MERKDSVPAVSQPAERVDGWISVVIGEGWFMCGGGGAGVADTKRTLQFHNFILFGNSYQL